LPMWDIETTERFNAWYEELGNGDLEAVNACVDLLAEQGPGLRRPFVGHIEMSRHPNMRELIVTAHDIRILFAFDPRRVGLLLMGGSKTDRWEAWYKENVPVADDLLDEHLAVLGRERR
jgi:hypothetical protein